MSGAVVGQMAALTQRSEIARAVIARILVKVGRRDENLGAAQFRQREAGQRPLACCEPIRAGTASHPTSTSVTPMPTVGIPPFARDACNHGLAVWLTALLAATAGPFEPDHQ